MELVEIAPLLEPTPFGAKYETTVPESYLVTTFLRASYDIVSNAATDSIVSWCRDGASFAVHDPDRFEATILGDFFKHANFPSFVRQLNMYCFHKVRSDTARWQFTHPGFVRGHPELLVDVKRKSTRKLRHQRAQAPPKKAAAPRPAAVANPDAAAATSPTAAATASTPSRKRRRAAIEDDGSDEYFPLPAVRRTTKRTAAMEAMRRVGEMDRAAAAAAAAGSGAMSGEESAVSGASSMVRDTEDESSEYSAVGFAPAVKPQRAAVVPVAPAHAPQQAEPEAESMAVSNPFHLPSHLLPIVPAPARSPPRQTLDAVSSELPPVVTDSIIDALTPNIASVFVTPRSRRTGVAKALEPEDLVRLEATARQRMAPAAAHRYTEDVVTKRNLAKLETFESATPTGCVTPTSNIVQPPLKRFRFTSGDITQQVAAQRQRGVLAGATRVMPEPSAAPRRPMPSLVPSRSAWAFDESELEEAFGKVPVLPPVSPVAMSVLASPSRVPVESLFEWA